MSGSFTDWQGDFLAHHGVLGQKWGVRHYQNPDGSLTPEGREHYGYTLSKKDVQKINKAIEKKGVRDARLREAHTIPKGTMVYRTTANDSEGESGTTYVSYMDVDRNHYKGGWIRNQSGGKAVFENSYTLNEDLKVPSRKEAMEVVNDVVGKNKDLIKKTVDAWAEAAMPTSSAAWQEWVWNKEYETGKFDRQEKELRKQFVDEKLKEYGSFTPNEAAFFAMQTFGVNKPLRDKVMKELSARGYNAMTDEASVGGQGGFGREGADPIIIFDRSGKLDKKSSKEIKRNEDDEYNRKYNKAISKSWRWDRRNDQW